MHRSPDFAAPAHQPHVERRNAAIEGYIVKIREWLWLREERIAPKQASCAWSE